MEEYFNNWAFRTMGQLKFVLVDADATPELVQQVHGAPGEALVFNKRSKKPISIHKHFTSEGKSDFF